MFNLSATKVTFNIRSRKFDDVTSDNSEHFKFIKISNVLVSPVVTAKKLKIFNGKGNSDISSAAKILFRVRTLRLRVCLQGKGKTISFFSSFKDVLMLNTLRF